MNAKVKRIDHLGIVAGTIKDLEIKDIINKEVGQDKQEGLSSGDVICGMILNGLGFVSKPLMLTPQYFENKPLDLLIAQGATADQFNRHKIGRVLDRIAEFGCNKLFTIIASAACIKEKIDMKFANADTTSFSLSGDYDQDSDTERINVTYGHSKAKRPDLKQVVQELITTQDGGIPFITQCWSGNESDVIIFRKRIEALKDEFAKTNNRYFDIATIFFTERIQKLHNI